VLEHLQHERRVDTPTVGRLTQKGESSARSVLEHLVERGLIEARGERRGRIYHLSASLQRRLGAPAGYVHTRGFDAIQQEAMVLQYVRAHGRITRREGAELSGLNEDSASRLLHGMADAGALRSHGTKRWTFYTLPPA
jgi:ATP-dependent DNA helicase RecG